MKTILTGTALTALLLLCGPGLRGQGSTFNAGIIAGLNFAELEGEGLTDYFGLNAGLLGTARLSNSFQLGIELLFSQNGEYILPEYYPPVAYGNIWLNHIEIPVHIDWLINLFKENRRPDVNFNIGLAYTRIISHRAEDTFRNDVSPLVRYGDRDACHLQPGMVYYFTERAGLNLKASLPIRSRRLDWTVAARMVYMLR